MIKRLSLFLLSVCTFSAVSSQTLDSVYRQKQAAIATAVQEEQKKLGVILQAMPEKADSINQAYTRFVMRQIKDASELAVQYASQVPEALDMLYRARNEVPKDTLRHVLSRLRRELASTAQASALRRFVECEPLQEGDALLEFPCIRSWSLSMNRAIRWKTCRR